MTVIAPASLATTTASYGPTAAPYVGNPVPQVGAVSVAPSMGTGSLPMAAQQATLGVEVMKPPSTIKTVLKNVLIFGGIGAVAGLAGSLLGLPIIGGFAAPIAAAIGGGVGAAIGLVKGIISARGEQKEYAAAVAAQNAAAAQPPVEVIKPDPPLTAAEGGKPASRKAAAGGASYTVKSGDTLSKIASRHGIDWHKLYAANKDAVGSNPNLIHPGLKLRIPG